MSWEMLTPPASEPVTVAEIKDHGRIDGTDDDTYLGVLITAGRELVERSTGLVLIDQGWRLTLDTWPYAGRDEWWDGVREVPISVLVESHVDLNRAPVRAITAVAVVDEDDAATTWAATNYYLARRPGGKGRLVRKSGVTWPDQGARTQGAIRIDATLGYGANASDVPSALRHAVKMCALHWYEHREPASACASAQVMPAGLGSIIASYRVR